MRASVSRSIAITALLYSNAVSAGPVLHRAPQVTESALDPWVSVDASGHPVATFTPVVTTIDGVATTINPVPATLTAAPTTASSSDDEPAPTSDSDPAAATTTSSDDEPAPTSDSGPAPTATGGGSYQVCHNTDGDFKPFCKPDNGSSVYVGESYYITWDTSFFPHPNTTVVVQANYVNASDGGPQAFQSPMVPSSYGFVSWTIDKAWLKDMKSNNLTLFIVSLGTNAVNVPGPTVMVTTHPKSYYHQPLPKVPRGPALYIALPVVLVFVVVCIAGGFYLNRHHRHIGLGSVMGRGKGYGVGKSRRQRLGLGKTGAIQLRDQDLHHGAGDYQVAPSSPEAGEQNLSAQRQHGHARADSDALGSLAGTPTEDRRNYFREEMRRQEEEARHAKAH
ncbi:hypothetical protein F5884DRAFT_332970 [Xylogone sp. PMI_703]|nr:hypothetical protein F5884DRAFT_332970 [Xylogone sp. PMI_703]